MMRKYTYVPDLPDFRDFAYQDHGPKVRNKPRQTNNHTSAFMPPIKDQGQLGSCTAHGGTSAIEFVMKKDGLDATPRSRLMYYYGERAYEHTTQSDSGAQIRDGIKFAVNTGVCVESLWPYNIAKFKSKPPAKCYTDAAGRKVAKYARLGADSLSGKKGNLALDMQNCMASGLPVVFGFTVYDSFEATSVANTGVVPMPKKGEQVLGGHCMLAVDYNLDRQAYLCANSWGTQWGMQGFCWMPMAYLHDANLAEDFWAILP